MINFSDKEIKYIQKVFKHWSNDKYCTCKNSLEIVINEIDSINTVEIINKLCMDLLDDLYSHLLIMKYDENDMREANYIEEDISLYKKIYEISE
jgi:hypothetical protein